jgi:hypothetical protein
VKISQCNGGDVKVVRMRCDAKRRCECVFILTKMSSIAGQMQIRRYIFPIPQELEVVLM